jgi:hypothetical protein
VGLLLESSDESACPWQRAIKIIDPEKQEQTVTRLRVIRAHQGRMLMCAPLVKAKQDRSIRINDLTEVVMGRSRLRQPKQRLVPLEAASHIANANDRPGALHGSSCFIQLVREISIQAARKKFLEELAFGADITYALVVPLSYLITPTGRRVNANVRVQFDSS